MLRFRNILHTEKSSVRYIGDFAVCIKSVALCQQNYSVNHAHLSTCVNLLAVNTKINSRKSIFVSVVCHIDMCEYLNLNFRSYCCVKYKIKPSWLL